MGHDSQPANTAADGKGSDPKSRDIHGAHCIATMIESIASSKQKATTQPALRACTWFTCCMLTLLAPRPVDAQQPSVKDLHFLVGTWQTEEHHLASGWWEKSTRTGTYILDSTYLQLESVAVNSSGKKRTYRFLIHYDSDTDQFEMVCIYSNWPKVRTEILVWDQSNRTIKLTGKPEADEYSERTGLMQFTSDFSAYTWKGANKSGKVDNPRVFEYEEKGKRVTNH